MSKYLTIEYFLSVLLVISTVSLIYPYGFPLFTTVAILYFFAFFIKERIKIQLNKGVILYYLLIVLYFLGILLSINGLTPYNVSDMENFIIIFILLLMMGNNSEITLQVVRKKYLDLCAYIIPIFAIYSLYKYSLLLKGIKIERFILEGRPYPWGTSLMPDYNMFALGLSIGLIATVYKITNEKLVLLRILHILSSAIIIFAIIFSGSRRGWIVLVLLAIYILISIIKMFRTYSLGKKISLIIALLISILVTFILTNSFSIEITDSHELEKLTYRFSTLNNLEGGFSSREDRWNYGFEIIKDYNIFNYLIGDGFNYIGLYGERYNTISGQDYPHNIFLSTFFYSGFIGLTLLLLLIILPYIRYFNNKSNMTSELIMIYSICLLFLTISGNSFFSINILWLITMILTTSKMGKSVF